MPLLDKTLAAVTSATSPTVGNPVPDVCHFKPTPRRPPPFPSPMTTDLPSQEELPDSALPAMSPHALAKDAEKKTRKKDKKKSENDAPATAQETSPSSAKVSSKASKSLPPAPGDVVRGEVLLSVKQWLAPSLMVSLDGGGIGRVCVTELADKSKWKNDPLSK